MDGWVLLCIFIGVILLAYWMACNWPQPPVE